MPAPVKYAICVVVFLAAMFFLNIMFSVALPAALGFAGWIAALLLSVAACRFVWRRLDETEGSGCLSTALVWAVVAGGVGFCGGFFGPMIFAPGANQGPLLGIFITGPLGFIGGGIAGAIYCAARRKR